MVFQMYVNHPEWKKVLDKRIEFRLKCARRDVVEALPVICCSRRLRSVGQVLQAVDCLIFVLGNADRSPGWKIKKVEKTPPFLPQILP
jgi:hypothetical protein